MEALLPDILRELGIPGVIAGLLYIILSREIQHLKESFAKHINRHEAYEKGVCGKIDDVYKRLNPISDSVNRILGYMEAKNDKSK